MGSLKMLLLNFKMASDIFGQLLDKIGLLFVSSSGHTGQKVSFSNFELSFALLYGLSQAVQFFFKNRPFPASFSLLSSFQQSVDSK